MENFSKSACALMMVGISGLGTGLPNIVSPIESYDVYECTQSVSKEQYSNCFNSDSNLDFELTPSWLFDLIKSKYEINPREELSIKYLLKSLNVSSLEMALVKLRSTISNYTVEIPQLTVFNDGEDDLLLVTVSAEDDIDKSLDMFEAIKNEWFAESTIDINRVLFLDIVA